MGQGGPQSGTRMREKKAPQVRGWGSGVLNLERRGLREEGLVLRDLSCFLHCRATPCRIQNAQRGLLPTTL